MDSFACACLRPCVPGQKQPRDLLLSAMLAPGDLSARLNAVQTDGISTVPLLPPSPSSRTVRSFVRK